MTNATDAKNMAAVIVTMRNAFRNEPLMGLIPHDQSNLPNMHKLALWFRSVRPWPGSPFPFDGSYCQPTQMFPLCSRGRGNPRRRVRGGLAHHCALRLGQARGHEDQARMPLHAVDAGTELAAVEFGRQVDVSALSIAAGRGTVSAAHDLELSGWLICCAL